MREYDIAIRVKIDPSKIVPSVEGDPTKWTSVDLEKAVRLCYATIERVMAVEEAGQAQESVNA